MKIYFAGSIKGGRENLESYVQLINHLTQYGQVLTTHIADKEVERLETKFSDVEIHNRDMEWLMQADAVVAEVSTPSLGVGYEIGRAVEKNKPVLCLYRKSSTKKLSAMIGGSKNIRTYRYDDITDAIREIECFISGIKQR